DEEQEKCCGHCQGVKKTDIAWGELLVLAVATSLDALAIGFSFSMAGRAIVIPAILIGIICLVLTALAVLAGKRLSEKAKAFEKPMTWLGALVLLLIGIRILFEHGAF
ncbi:MAG: manganese efflux pump, partial [Burkholderiaceae bacterium]|nr:manganese efflux pump [Burkholderiaceae bacterium]